MKIISKDGQDLRTSEKYLEKQVVKIVAMYGGLALKITSQYHRGLPDRLCLYPDGSSEWIELKSSGRKPTRLQQETHRQLRSFGQTVRVIDGSESLEDWIAEMLRKYEV